VPTKTRLNSIQKLLIWSAGADQEILSQESCRTERYKYESIGTTVILTAIMAFCSGGYALFTVFGSLTISISLGFIWGSIISSSKLQFWVGAVTRLSIAILLGFIVAKPLELRLFESEINQKISQQRREREREESRKDQDTPDVKRINKINEEIDNLTREKNQASDALQKARIDAIEEIKGKGVTGKPGVGTIAKERQKNVETIEKSVTFLDSRIQDLLKEKNSLIKKQQSSLSIKTPQKKEWQEGSLLDRISALEALSKDDPAIAITNKLITLLLIIIEIAPVLVKILSKEGLYEKLLEKETIDRMNQENLGKMAEKELSKMKELKNFQLNIEALIIEYIRLRERNKEKIEDIQMNKAKNIYQQHDEETANFVKLCRERVTNYEDLVD